LTNTHCNDHQTRLVVEDALYPGTKTALLPFSDGGPVRSNVMTLPNEYAAQAHASLVETVFGEGMPFPAQGLNHLAARTTAIIMSAPNNEATAIARRGTPSRQAPTSAQEEKGR